MAGAWRDLDLNGGGLQAANREISRRLRRRPAAYALACLYPLGLHRDYLGDRRGAWLYRLATGLTAIGAWLHPAALAIGAGAVTLAAIVDLARMESRIAAANKRIRMAVYLGQTDGAPAGFAGRDFEAKSAAESPRAEPGASGEAMLLRDIAALKGRRRP
jgi:hypothetical protein